MKVAVVFAAPGVEAMDALDMPEGSTVADAIARSTLPARLDLSTTISYAIHGQRGPRGHAREIGRAHDDRPQPPHLLFQQTDGIVQLVAAKRVAAHELRQPVGLVDRGRAHGAHFVEGDANAERGGLPGGLAAGQAAADDGNHDLRVPKVPGC